jgi:valyl-tRNA synthetase
VEAKKKALQQLEAKNASLSCMKFQRDDDVLDTWFSSALLPLSATEEEATQVGFKLSMMETGHDILFFWVARMIMLCSIMDDGRLPFPIVLLHGMVRDAQGRKMSKSLGNVVDPLAVIHGRTQNELLADLEHGNLPASELIIGQRLMKKQFPKGIPECGADALRMGLLSLSSSQSHVVPFDLSHIISMRHFCNKVWHATKYVLGHIARGMEGGRPRLNKTMVWLPNQWILSRYAAYVAEIEALMESYRPGSAVDESIRFFVKEFCDVYLEMCKSQGTLLTEETQSTLWYVLQAFLRILHPFAPFLTETLYQSMHNSSQPRESIMETLFPDVMSCTDYRQPLIEIHMTSILDVIRQIRAFHQTQQLPFSSTAILLCVSDENLLQKLLPFQSLIQYLTRCPSLTITSSLDSSTSPFISISVDRCI